LHLRTVALGSRQNNALTTNGPERKSKNLDVYRAKYLCTVKASGGVDPLGTGFVEAGR